MRKKSIADFISDYGTSKLAKDLGLHWQTVYYWSTGHSAPAPPMALKLILLSKGQLDFNSIFTEFATRKLKEKEL